jgi:hypothetical protein
MLAASPGHGDQHPEVQHGQGEAAGAGQPQEGPVLQAGYQAYHFFSTLDLL